MNSHVCSRKYVYNKEGIEIGRVYFIEKIIQHRIEGDNKNEEIVFLVVKEETSTNKDAIREEKELRSSMNRNNDWIIDIGFSHHMIGDKDKFLTMEQYDGVL